MSSVPGILQPLAVAFLNSLAGSSGEVSPLPSVRCCTLKVFQMDGTILQVGLDAVLASIVGMPLVSVAFREHTIEKLLGILLLTMLLTCLVHQSMAFMIITSMQLDCDLSRILRFVIWFWQHIWSRDLRLHTW